MQFSTKYLFSLFIMGLAFLALGAAVLAAITQMTGGIKFAVSEISTQKQGTFDVTGESTVTTVPDQAEVNVGITVTSNTVQGAQDQANQTMNGIIAQMGQLGIPKEDIQTQSYSLYPNYDFQTGSQRITGYTVNASLLVNLTDFSLLNQVIDGATGAGANQIGGITFSLSDEKENEIRETARAEAIGDAKDNAQQLARLAGMNLGRVVNVIEITPVNQPPIMFREAALAVDQDGGRAGAPTNVEPGSTNYTYSVILSFETL